MNYAIITGNNVENTHFTHLEHGMHVSVAWVYAEDKMQELVGGTISFHRTNDSGSFMAGTITSVFSMPDRYKQHRIGITFQASDEVVSAPMGKREQLRY